MIDYKVMLTDRVNPGDDSCNKKHDEKHVRILVGGLWFYSMVYRPDPEHVFEIHHAADVFSATDSYDNLLLDDEVTSCGDSVAGFLHHVGARLEVSSAEFHENVLMYQPYLEHIVVLGSNDAINAPDIKPLGLEEASSTM